MAKLLSILLQRSDPAYPWGFSVSGGREQQTPLLIDQVTPLSLAAQYLAPGDTVLEIEKVDTRQLWPEQVGAFIARPGRSLELLIQKGSGVVNPYPSNPRAYSRTAQSPTPKDQTNRSTYASSDSGAGSSLSSKRNLRDNFWERVTNDLPDFGRERYNRLSNGSPFRDRQSRMDLWRRCQSEEKTNPHEEKFNSFFSEKPSNFSSPIQSVWSPTPSDRLRSQTSQSSDYWSSQETKGSTGERQEDFKFWNDRLGKQQSESTSSRSGSLNRSYKRHNSDFTHDYSSYSSESASTPKSFTSPEPRIDFMKKPSDFWNDHYRNLECRMRLGSLLSPPLDSPFKNSNISSKSEFKKSVSFKEQTYSSGEGAKSYETFEHVNKTKETEKTSKLKEDGKEEVVEKTKKNKEYVLANKDDVNGQPKETKKVISDFKIIEKIMDGEQEFCNKVKEHSEEVTNSNTPVNFYDNLQQHDESQQKAQLSDESVNRKKAVHSYESGTNENIDASSGSFSPLDRPFGHKWQMSSTPVSGVGDPIKESFFEVDIRTPLESQSWNTFTSTEEFLRRQSSQISGGGGGSSIPVSPPGDAPVAPPPPPPQSFCPPAPPPPPPPGPAVLPNVRLSTEIPDKRRSAYEPPAAIQNAMMTKDKKPFTYTPGGLDLSEIRSPRMARRINRNANTPDLAPPPPPQQRPSPLAGQPLPPSAMAAMQPQIAIAVLPQGGGSLPSLQHVTLGGQGAPPPPPPQPKTSPPVQNIPTPPSPPYKAQPPSSPQRIITNRQPSPPPMAVPKPQPQHRHTKSDDSTPGSIYVPPIDNQTPRAQLGSLYIPPLASQEPVKMQSPPVSQLNKAPTPWMSRQAQVTKEVPSWVNKENVQSPPPPPQPQLQGQPQTRIIPIQIEGRESSQPNTRIIPIQLEATPSPQHSPQQPNYNQQQYQQQQYQQQQQQYQQQPQQQYQQQPQQQYQQQPQQHHYQPQQSYEQPQSQSRQNLRWMNQQPIYVHNKFNTGSQSPVPVEQNHGDGQSGWRHSQTNGTLQSPGPGPVQSQSFKVLQKITGTDSGIDQTDAPYNSQGVPLSQLRKLELSDDDRALMNKVKSQVDDETFLHNESDPRYRGSAIPSRAFRILQTMTDGSHDGSDVPRGYSPMQAGQNRAGNQTPQPEAPQQYIPPSEQQVQEPRKYTGGAIPSRSFRMLQAMTAGPDTADRPGESEY